MVSFRAIVLWLMMLAVPFQAYAAAAMTLCEPGESHTPAASALTTDDHHRSHAAAETNHHGAHVDVHHDDEGGPDQGHKCGNCAPCHGVGITPNLAALIAHRPPQADLVEPLYPLASVTPSIPHKPPRA